MTRNIDLARLMDLRFGARPRAALICLTVVVVLIPVILAAGLLALVTSAVLAIFRTADRTDEPDGTRARTSMAPFAPAASTTAS